MDPQLAEARAFTEALFPGATAFEHLGDGAWSRCFGFDSGSQPLVIRFGHHISDFRKDRQAAHYASERLPIPAVLDIGEAFDGWYAVSERVAGTPLEHATPDQWNHLVPQLVEVFEALRSIDISESHGWGEWEADGSARFASWRDFLLSVADDGPETRLTGWRPRLAATQGTDVFDRVHEALALLNLDGIDRCVVHSDMINANVHVDEGRITGIFDWGACLYGDHLMELAWFQFWNPWHENLDTGLLRRSVEHRWGETDRSPTNVIDRLQACYFHIALVHFAYAAWRDDFQHYDQILDRMVALTGFEPRT